MLKRPAIAWAITDAITGTLLTFDARAPIYWLRAVAQQEAQERGLTTTGRAPDVRIVRVQVHQYSGKAR